ncbi:hypothetical protein L1887_10453 [Cichorium endivia]|nr:hypothetical protein L1887_10453 [Cichorium endivia]
MERVALPPCHRDDASMSLREGNKEQQRLSSGGASFPDSALVVALSKGSSEDPEKVVDGRSKLRLCYLFRSSEGEAVGLPIAIGAER